MNFIKRALYSFKVAIIVSLWKDWNVEYYKRFIVLTKHGYDLTGAYNKIISENQEK